MLLKLSDRISECLVRAAELRERAKADSDPARRADFFDMELHWLRLVESYRFVEQMERFIQDGRSARTPSGEGLSQTGVLVVECPTTGKQFSTGILSDAVTFALLPQELTRSHCPHCNSEHPWRPKDAKLIGALPRSEWVEVARADAASRGTGSARDNTEALRPVVNRASLADILDVLVRTANQYADGGARAAFYIADADGTALHHVVGMPQAYARHVDGFSIGPESLACGLAAATGQPIITRDVTEEPLWTPWLWLAKEFDYRACWSFPIGTSAGKVLGTFAMYYKEPREATQRDLDVAATLTRAAALIIDGPHPAVQLQ
jgi:GAF domain